MAKQPVDSQAAAALYEILRDYISGDVEGQNILAEFEQDHEAGAKQLLAYLQRRIEMDDASARTLPPALQTIIHGGHVERIVNIAQAETVIVSSSDRKRRFLWLGLAIVLAVAVVIVAGPSVILWWLKPNIEPIPNFRGMYVSAITQNPKNDDVWLAIAPDGSGGGLYHYIQNEGWTDFTQENEGFQTEITSILVTADGAVWFGTHGSGAIVLTGSETASLADDKWKTYSDKEGLADPKVSSMAEDQQKNIWVGTFGGLSRLTPQEEWLYYDPQTGWTHDWQALSTEDRLVAHVIRVDKQTGDVWVAARDELFRWAANDLDGQPVHYDQDDALSHKTSLGTGFIFSLAFDDAGQLWVGTSEGFVSVLETGTDPDDRGDDQWRTFQAVPELDTAIWSLLPMPDGRVLAGTAEGGLRIYYPYLDRWVGYSEFAPEITALLLEKRKRILIGSDQGLGLWEY